MQSFPKFSPRCGKPVPNIEMWPTFTTKLFYDTGYFLLAQPQSHTTQTGVLINAA